MLIARGEIWEHLHVKELTENLEAEWRAETVLTSSGTFWEASLSWLQDMGLSLRDGEGCLGPGPEGLVHRGP